MERFFNAVSAVFVLLMLMAVGYFMGNRGWMTAREKKFVSKYIINIAVPCTCITGVLNNLSHQQMVQAGLMVVSCAVGVGLTMALSAGVAQLLRLPKSQWGVFVAMAGLANTLFIGLPLATQLFGEVCLPYVMVYYLANTAYTQTVALILIERSGTQSKPRGGVWGFCKNIFTKPPVLGMLASILLLALDLRPPEVFMRFAGYIGNSVTPLALIYCGFIIYELGLKNIRFQRGLPTMIVMRLVISPLICLGMCRLTGIGGLARNVFVVESALPVVSQVTVLAGAFGADEQYAATGATLSTLGCFFTIPILMLLLG